MRENGTARIGTSGYHYNHWRGVFYTEDLPKAQWLSYYARNFDTVEINNTFYHLPSAAAFDSWKTRRPMDSVTQSNSIATVPILCG